VETATADANVVRRDCGRFDDVSDVVHGQRFVAPRGLFPRQAGDLPERRRFRIAPQANPHRRTRFRNPAPQLRGDSPRRPGREADLDPGTTSTETSEKRDLGAARLEAILDQIDDAFFPRHGNSSTLELILSRGALGADDEYDKLSLTTLQAWTYGKGTLLGRIALGTDLGSDLPFYDQFALGGFLNLRDSTSSATTESSRRRPLPCAGRSRGSRFHSTGCVPSRLLGQSASSRSRSCTDRDAQAFGVLEEDGPPLPCSSSSVPRAAAGSGFSRRFTHPMRSARSSNAAACPPVHRRSRPRLSIPRRMGSSTSTSIPTTSSVVRPK